MISLQLAEDIAAKDAAREEMERIRMELYLEEQEEKERQKERVGGSKCCVTSIEVDQSSVSQVVVILGWTLVSGIRRILYFSNDMFQTSHKEDQ